MSDTSDGDNDKRAAKIGALKVEEAEAARREAAQWEAARASAQPALFELAAADGPLPDDDKPSGPGRPVGARAATPREFRRYVLATKGDFIARFAGLANVDTFALAKVLGCTPIEALILQRDLGKVAAPYIYQQQPRALELEDAGKYFAGMLFVANGGAPAADPGTDAPMLNALAALAGRPADMQEIQALAPVDFVGSEPAQSEPAEAEEEEAP